MVRELRAGGTTILLTTQYLEEADQLAQRIAVIDGGRIVAEGTADRAQGAGRSRPAGRAAQRRVESRGRPRGAGAGDGGRTTGGARRRRGWRCLSRTRALPADAVRALDRIGVGIAGLEVRSPTLDDVFFTLTGKHVEQPDDDQEEEEEMAA